MQSLAKDLSPVLLFLRILPEQARKSQDRMNGPKTSCFDHSEITDVKRRQSNGSALLQKHNLDNGGWWLAFEEIRMSILAMAVWPNPSFIFELEIEQLDSV